jgi:hypothetical protein
MCAHFCIVHTHACMDLAEEIGLLSQSFKFHQNPFLSCLHAHILQKCVVAMSVKIGHLSLSFNFHKNSLKHSLKLIWDGQTWSCKELLSQIKIQGANPFWISYFEQTTFCFQVFFILQFNPFLSHWCWESHYWGDFLSKLSENLLNTCHIFLLFSFLKSTQTEIQYN